MADQNGSQGGAGSPAGNGGGSGGAFGTAGGAGANGTISGGGGGAGAAGGAGGGALGSGSGGGSAGSSGNLANPYLNATVGGTGADAAGDDGAGGGGGGGNGILDASAGASLIIGSATGAQGGAGGNNDGAPGSVGGGGGSGGYGVAETGSNDYVQLNLPVTGGDGGAGGTSATGQGDSNGGDGGGGVYFGNAGSTLNLNGVFTVHGGTGGKGGTGGSGSVLGQRGGDGGAGGDGVDMIAGGVIENDDSIILGGTGGGAGDGNAGVGGVGIVGQNLTIDNYGQIAGGMSGAGNGATQADAIEVTGGTNVLTLHSPYDPLSGGIGVSGSLAIDPGTTVGSNLTLTNQIHDESATPGSLDKIGPGTLTFSSANTYSGGTTIAGGMLVDAPAVAGTSGIGTGAVSFAGTLNLPATLALSANAQPANGGTFANALNTFGVNDALDLQGLTFSSARGNGVTYDSTTGHLTVTEGTRSETFTLMQPSTTNFFATNDGTGGTEVLAAPPTPVCFAAGTRIRVARGGAVFDVAVENLVVGDLAVTASGVLRPIRWLGHRLTDCRRHPRPVHVQPVCIAAHAFGPSRPMRDLVVSPGHAICVDAMGEILVPAGALVDGETILRLDVAQVTYWHVELDAHDILLAENLPAESYLDMGNRRFFAEAEAVALHALPDAPVVTHLDFCRPFVDRGPQLDAVRTRLACLAQRGSFTRGSGRAVETNPKPADRTPRRARAGGRSGS